MSEMVLSREEKEKLVLDLYYNKGYTYRQLAKELKMSPNQIRDIIRRHEEKDNAIANRKRELSLSSKAYKLYSKGKGASGDNAGYSRASSNSISP